MIPRLKDLIAPHRVTLYAIDGMKFNIICDNMLEAQGFANSQASYRYTPGYAIEKVQKDIGLNINHH